MGNILNTDFQDFLLALNTAHVKYVLVGGYSVIYYGYPRTTGDLDIFVEVSKENYSKIAHAFSVFKMPVFDMTEDAFLNKREINVFSFGKSPVSIEILKEITGLTFKEVYKNASDIKYENIPLKIIHLNDLIKNKKSAGRPKDINDIDNLTKKP